MHAWPLLSGKWALDCAQGPLPLPDAAKPHGCALQNNLPGRGLLPLSPIKSTTETNNAPHQPNPLSTFPGLVATHSTPPSSTVPPAGGSAIPSPSQPPTTVQGYLYRSTRTQVSSTSYTLGLPLVFVNHPNFSNHVRTCRQCHRPDGHYLPHRQQRSHRHGEHWRSTAHRSRGRGCACERRRGQATLHWKPRVRDHRGGVEGILQGLPGVGGPCFSA